MWKTLIGKNCRLKNRCEIFLSENEKNWTNGWNIKWVKKIGVGENILSEKVNRKLESVKRFWDRELVWKNSSQRVSKIEAFDGKILGSKTGVKILDEKWMKCSQWNNFRTAKWGEKFQDGKLVQKSGIGKKILGLKIGMKNYFAQKMEKIVLVHEKFYHWKNSNWKIA